MNLRLFLDIATEGMISEPHLYWMAGQICVCFRAFDAYRSFSLRMECDHIWYCHAYRFQANFVAGYKFGDAK